MTGFDYPPATAGGTVMIIAVKSVIVADGKLFVS